MIGVGKVGEFIGRKERINTSYYSFSNMSLNRSDRARVHALERVSTVVPRRCFSVKERKTEVGYG